jgi:hypothetical protein
LKFGDRNLGTGPVQDAEKVVDKWLKQVYIILFLMISGMKGEELT